VPAVSPRIPGVAASTRSQGVIITQILEPRKVLSSGAVWENETAIRESLSCDYDLIPILILITLDFPSQQKEILQLQEFLPEL
jgi:hypothetical protein